MRKFSFKSKFQRLFFFYLIFFSFTVVLISCTGPKIKPDRAPALAPVPRILTKEDIYGENSALKNSRHKVTKEYLFKNSKLAYPDQGKEMLIRQSALDKNQVVEVQNFSPVLRSSFRSSVVEEANQNRFTSPNKGYYSVPVEESVAKVMAVSKSKVEQENSYRIEAQEQEDGFEPNNLPDAGFDLRNANGRWISFSSDESPGRLTEGVQKDDDWFKIRVSPYFRRLIVDLRYQHYLGNIDLEIYNAKSELIASSTRSGDDEFISIILDQGGDYRIRVFGESLGNRYDFRYTTEFVNGSDDIWEENDSLGSAANISKYEGIWLSEIFSEGIAADHDYFKILVPQNRRIVKLDIRYLIAGGDIDLKLIAGNGEVLATSSHGGDDDYIEFQVPAAGTYFIKVYPTNSGLKIPNMYDLKWSLGASSQKAPSQVSFQKILPQNSRWR